MKGCRQNVDPILDPFWTPQIFGKTLKNKIKNKVNT